MAAPQQIVFVDPQEQNIYLRIFQEAWVIMKREQGLPADLALNLPVPEDHPLYGFQLLLNGQQGNIPRIYFDRAWNVLHGWDANAWVPGFPRLARFEGELDFLGILHEASLEAPAPLPPHPEAFNAVAANAVAANAVAANEPVALNSNSNSNMEINNWRGGSRRKNTRKGNRKNRKSRKYNKRR